MTASVRFRRRGVSAGTIARAFSKGSTGSSNCGWRLSDPTEDHVLGRIKGRSVRKARAAEPKIRLKTADTFSVRHPGCWTFFR